MAKKEQVKKCEAVALCDLPQFSLKAGTIVSGTKEFIDSLADNGMADPNPAAIAYAQEQRAETVEFA